MSKHTPGPWLTGRVVYYIGKPDRCNVWGPINHAAGDQSGEIICELATLANARLIAAAPDMLDALRWAERELRRVMQTEACAGAALAKVLNAIESATGVQS